MAYGCGVVVSARTLPHPSRSATTRREKPSVILRRLVPFLAVVAAERAGAQDVWSAPVRGSWVQAGTVSADDVTLASPTATAEIVVAASEASNVKQAAAFLATDIERISGHKPNIVATPTKGATSIRLMTLGDGALPRDVDTRGMEGQWESYRVTTTPNTVWLVGSNARGTAFAAYTLSERLGVDPLYLWTGYVPARHDPLVMKRTRFGQQPPTFRFRGFFHDDEDILPRPFDERGYPSQLGDVPLEWYKRFFETALRLRMNMVAPYTRVHRRYEVQKLASDWGLYYTSHHYDILVSNPWGLTRFNLAAERGVKPEYDWFTNREGMLTFWRGGVLENRDLDVIWPVGMRNTTDAGYHFPPGITDEDKAKVFHDVIAQQVGMVRELLPKNKTPLFHFTMYTEMLDQYRRNPAAFDLPSDVIIVWPDDNDGHMRGLPLPTELGRWKHGIYYHLAYLGGNLSKQVTHTVAPATIAQEFAKVVNAGATEFMLVNMSEVREYVMGARMIADITWNAPAVYAMSDPATGFTNWWSREYFGESAAPVADSTYAAYFALLDRPDRLWAAADAVQALLQRLQKRVAGLPYPPMNADTLALLQSRRKQLDLALLAEGAAEARMTRQQAQYFSEDAGLGLAIDDRQTAAALELASALEAPDSTHMWDGVFKARGFLESLETEIARAEHPPFERWYHETWIRTRNSRNNPHRSYEQVRAFMSHPGAEERRDAPAPRADS